MTAGYETPPRLNELILDEYCTNSLNGKRTEKAHQNYITRSPKHISTGWSAVSSVDVDGLAFLMKVVAAGALSRRGLERKRCLPKEVVEQPPKI